MPRGRSFSVRWAKTASLDLESILDFIAEDSPERAEGILNEIEAAASGLAFHPKRGRIVPELAEQGMLLYRELVHGPWRIIYRIEAATVLVLSVIDGRRNLEDLLLRRFLH